MTLVNTSKLWKSKTIQYMISSNAENVFGDSMRFAVGQLNTLTVLNFIPFLEYVEQGGSFRARVLRFKHKMHHFGVCGASVGGSIVFCGQTSVYFGSIIHEILRCLGFYHEHQRMNGDGGI